MVQGYCVVCKKSGGKTKREMKNPVIEKTARGGFIAKGICADCGKTKMCAMMSEADAKKAIESGEAKKGF